MEETNLVSSPNFDNNPTEGYIMINIDPWWNSFA
jgi:hypothetical protein